MNKIYLTTPLYYVNAAPHIGHSYTNVAADALARYRRSKNFKVLFLTGTDEHGQKVERSAINAGLSPIEFADRTVDKFKDLWRKLDISYDDFIRTTEPRHINAVQKVLDVLYKKGDIYQAKYEGWYCTPCETFWTEVDDQVICPDCKRPLEKISETNFFFKLSKYQDWLIKHFKENPDFVLPSFRYNEAFSFISKNKLEDLCISRPKSRLRWGIQTPFSKDHVTYVWFDALINYISAVGYGDDNKKLKQWWPADVHFIGKDILRQHAIYWPIMLKALELKQPKMIVAHGWWLIGKDEAKMSKSLGNIVDPNDVISKFGIDTYRYFLLREIAFGADGKFSQEAIITRYNSDLANDFGNLVYRSLTMVEKYYSGVIPKAKNLENNAKIRVQIASLSGKVEACMQKIRFSSALEVIWEVVKSANKHVEETKPWNLAKEKKEDELADFIALLVEVIKEVGRQIDCFMPHTAAKIREQFLEDKVIKGKPLFPRIESKKQ
ncbi:MAG TPA: methionine--tRNA ligase [Candidatus Omnitrophica bacterium]|nr:methionine--tRNA ligase [Candidatus Omnitrophota bacterium]